MVTFSKLCPIFRLMFRTTGATGPQERKKEDSTGSLKAEPLVRFYLFIIHFASFLVVPSMLTNARRLVLTNNVFNLHATFRPFTFKRNESNLNGGHRNHIYGQDPPERRNSVEVPLSRSSSIPHSFHLETNEKHNSTPTYYSNLRPISY